MAGNTTGTIFRLTTFGESHGPAIGGVIDGCPAGLEIDVGYIQRQLNRRKPGQSSLTTQRSEDDGVEFLSGLFESKTTGTPIAFLIRNKNQNSSDYDHLKDTFRPSHADFTYHEKYGIRDYRGGGRSSARETAARVVGGAVARLLLLEFNLEIHAWVSQIGNVVLEQTINDIDFGLIDKSPVRCPDHTTSKKMVELINLLQEEGDTIGGAITCMIKNVPLGLGEPVFDKLQADLAKSMMGINAVKGFEYGSGFSAISMKGSDHNDLFEKSNDKIVTTSNFSGGIQGGISNGQDIYFRVAFKPVATIMLDQVSVDKDGEHQVIKGKGRHDVCVVPRAVPIVEAMASLVIADHYLRNKASKR
ncbi:MAG: chorismate synthase [Bacteroidales bacterium]